METREIAVAAHDVTKIFHSNEVTVTALENVSIDIHEGEFVSLVGPSGCGKTTLLRIIGGLTNPTKGSVETLPLSNGSPRKMSFVFQDVNLLPWRSVLRNVEFGLEPITSISKSERKERSMAALKKVGLDSFAASPPFTLSGGMQQRVGLARALAVEPDVLLMDEPFGALDNFTREGLQEQLAQLWEDMGTTIIFVTHDIDEAIYLSTEIVLLRSNPGRLVEVLPVDLPPKRWTYDVRSEPAAVTLHRHVRTSLSGRNFDAPPAVPTP